MFVGQRYQGKVTGQCRARDLVGQRLFIAEEVAELADGGVLAFQRLSTQLGQIDAVGWVQVVVFLRRVQGEVWVHKAGDQAPWPVGRIARFVA